MKNILRSIIVSGMILISLFISYSYVFSYKKTPAAEAGIIDLSRWNFSKEGMVNLNGQWQLYDHQLLTHEDFTGKSKVKPKLTGYRYLTATRQNHNNKSIEAKGVRTYRLVVKMKPSDKVFGLKLGNIMASNRVYVNGAEVGSSGNPAERNEGYSPRITPYSTYFNINGSKAEIILQVANFEYPFKRTMYQICLGLQKNINFMVVANSSIELSGIIIMFLLAVYSLNIYALQRKSRIYLYLGVNFLASVFLIISNGERLITQIFPNMSFELVCKMEGIAVVLFVLSLLRIVDEVNEKIITNSIMFSVDAVSTVYIVIVLTTRYSVYAHLLLARDIFITAVLIVTIIKLSLLLSDNSRKSFERKETTIFLEAVICSVICLGNNFLYSFDIIDTKLIGSSAGCGFVILLSSIMSNRFLMAYRNMERMSKKLIKMDKVKDEFIARTSYELKAPLYGMVDMTDIIIKNNMNCLKDENIKRVITLKNMALKLSGIINDILDVALLKNGQLKVNIGMIDIKVFADIVVESYKHIIQGRNIDIVNNIKESTFVKADESRINQIFFSLIINSVRNMNKGIISIDSRKDEHMIFISIEDTGLGIPEDKRENIFEPYKTSNSERIGLGLYITRQLVELMHGEIHLEWSEIGKGSCFVFSLPLCEENDMKYNKIKVKDAGYINKFSPIDYAETVQNEKHYGTILIVDDEILNIKIALNIFSSEGYNALTAMSAEEALKKIEENKIDLVLLDAIMPGISGIDLCRKIRQKHSLIELPILMSTIKDINYELFLGFEAGANDFITKPFEAKEMIARVRSLILLKRYMEDALKNEMAFLQAQIKPHFLYNTISTIISFCYTDGEKAAKLLTNFSKYLRLTFDIDNRLMVVSLRRELEMVDAYVEIVKARFGNKIHVEYDIKQTLMDARIPSLCIQPLVENAIKHGLCKKNDGGTVYVIIKKINNIMYILVKDTGAGMTSEQVEHLKNIENENSIGIGYKNVVRRIKALKNASIDINSIEGKGTTVKISIKCI
ncbi:response regulator [Clostridium tyrobutyricum]|uniref:sensor histidine kinase n=1 Tax=Clostridium tyrobutyricum TaxID=1519 RepID=UPI001C38D878|nr:ATP-binding protein [Clostridium tyrobutyricum]MBV4417848.1 response regulator [Clostridium tyrobutyricum]